MDGYIQTALGIIVSLVLFVIGYRQTIGAKKERSKNANSSIMRTIMRRMVLEDYSPIYKDITRLVEGKAREFQVSPNDLLSEEQILNSLYTEVFDSDLISPSQRIEIESRINADFEVVEREPIKPSFSEFQQLRQEKERRKESLTAMVLSASLLGALSSTMYSFYESKSFQLDSLLPSLGVLVGSIAMLTVLTMYRRSKEVESLPSRVTSSILASEFESDIANILVKNRFKFVIEPNLGGVRPDFLVSTNGKKIAIEAKSWQGQVPLHHLRRAIDYLHRLVSNSEVDRAILVTRKKDGIPTGSIEDENVSVVSINELVSKLKEAA
ncbi:restriction endonuclease [Salinicola halophilus]|uniref:restriction endonuclease n=1 Tax=Salinicola halophilus TaxID=184065 RepID=UPI0013A6622A|nr:restriction endonuclease [Salinicola halophilus]